MKQATDNLRITDRLERIHPEDVLAAPPITSDAATTVFEARQEISDILNGKDDRLVVIVGPCSIHNVDGALAYAEKLAQARQRHARDLLVIMRVYFEKPR